MKETFLEIHWNMKAQGCWPFAINCVCFLIAGKYYLPSNNRVLLRFSNMIPFLLHFFEIKMILFIDKIMAAHRKYFEIVIYGGIKANILTIFESSLPFGKGQCGAELCWWMPKLKLCWCQNFVRFWLELGLYHKFSHP